VTIINPGVINLQAKYRNIAIRAEVIIVRQIPPKLTKGNRIIPNVVSGIRSPNPTDVIICITK